jgi:sugar-specific transcriptional regulator TrmB/DNA-binding CsgD family transcriptional regulator
MLAVLGASPEEDRVYSQLVTAVTASESEIAEATGLSADAVRTALASLIDRGLAGRTPDSPVRFVAASPGVVESMISERLGELRAAQATLDRLASQYRANSIAQAATGVFEIVRGIDALRQTSMGMLSSARSEVLNMVKPPIIAVQSDEHAMPNQAATGRLIFETQSLEIPGTLETIEKGLRSKDEVRVHTRLPIKMLVVDRSAALLPLAQQDTTPVGVLVRESAVLDAMLALFEHVWAAAVPLHVDNENSPRPGCPSVLSDDDRRLLSLLLSGLTDEAIAAHRGTSVRTVQRKVQALMSIAHVRTRMQLAWEAARQGWM